MTTLNEAVETIRAHFSREGARLGKVSIAEGRDIGSDSVPSCLYRHPADHERRCAVGVLFTDEEHDAMLKEQVVRKGYESPVLTASVRGLHDTLTTFPDRLRPLVDQLGQIQRLHDNAKDPENFLTGLDRYVASL